MKEKIRLINGTVTKAVQETHDTWTLQITVNDADRQYKAGQFISIDPHQFPVLHNIVRYLEKLKGKKELVRAYSLASAPHEPYVAITTKPEAYRADETEYPPVLSPLLASNLLQGQPIQFLGYTGAYTLPEDMSSHTDHVVHMVAGSGAVPNYGILKDELINKKNLSVKHTLIDVNKTTEDIIYHQELNALAQAYPDRFKLIHLLTREENPSQHGSYYRAGRPTLELLQEVITDPNRTLVYSCGAGITKWQRKKAQAEGKEPQPRFLETVASLVTAAGISKQRFKREIYG